MDFNFRPNICLTPLNKLVSIDLVDILNPKLINNDWVCTLIRFKINRVNCVWKYWLACILTLTCEVDQRLKLIKTNFSFRANRRRLISRAMAAPKPIIIHLKQTPHGKPRIMWSVLVNYWNKRDRTRLNVHPKVSKCDMIQLVCSIGAHLDALLKPN